MHGGISILSRSIRGPTPCVNSTFIRAMAHFITDGLQLTGVQPPSRAEDSAAGQPKMRVVWALRSNRAGRQDEILDLLHQRLPGLNAEVRGPGVCDPAKWWRLKMLGSAVTFCAGLSACVVCQILYERHCLQL